MLVCRRIRNFEPVALGTGGDAAHRKTAPRQAPRELSKHAARPPTAILGLPKPVKKNKNKKKQPPEASPKKKPTAPRVGVRPRSASTPPPLEICLISFPFNPLPLSGTSL